jgi:2-polyprenyl-6-methoxyphenol hydroxylase-like FAD-dependent oxidoreductase
VTQTIQTPVLIVGAGPIGLTMAIDLAYNGIECLLIEKSDGKINHPKIGTIVTRTMEFFRRWGFVDKIRTSGFPDDYKLAILFCTSMTGHLLERDAYPSTADTPLQPFTPHKRQRCPQMWLDPILQQEAKDRGEIDLRFGTTLESFEDTGNGVVAQVRKADGELVTVEAQYMVGCDGALSTIRGALDISMQGNPKLNYSVGILFKCPSLVEKTNFGELERAILVGPQGTWGNLTVIDGSEMWRVTIFGSEERFDIATFDAEEWVRKALGSDDIPFEVLTIVPWRRTELVAENYRKGRVFLAGDAAHTMSPTGGMGVNTGFGDVMDLGWKLAATFKGWGGENLLNSYEAERRPIAVRNAAFSTHNFKTWNVPVDTTGILTEGPEGDALRIQIGTALKENTKSDWQSWGIQLGYRYEDSPICVADGTTATPDEYTNYIQTSRPGHRAPHAWLADGRSTLDLFGREFVLLDFGAEARETAAFVDAAAARGVPLRIEKLDNAEIAALYEQPLVLVRPDGHIAWRGHGGVDKGEILDVARGTEPAQRAKTA